MDKIRVLAEGVRFPEGPAFDESGCLWCVEQEGEGLFCRSKEGSTMRVHTGGRPNGSVIRDGYLWFCDSGQNAIRRMSIDTKAIETVIRELNGKPLNKPNDLVFDERGNLLFTCPGSEEGEESGYVAVRTFNGLVQVIADGLAYPNGLTLFPDALNCRNAPPANLAGGFWDSEELSWEAIQVWTRVIDATVSSIHRVSWVWLLPRVNGGSC